jgi:hypothetical protein
MSRHRWKKSAALDMSLKDWVVLSAEGTQAKGVAINRFGAPGKPAICFTAAAILSQQSACAHAANLPLNGIAANDTDCVWPTKRNGLKRHRRPPRTPEFEALPAPLWANGIDDTSSVWAEDAFMPGEYLKIASPRLASHRPANSRYMYSATYLC